MRRPLFEERSHPFGGIGRPEGARLVAVYAIVAVALYFLPASAVPPFAGR